MEARLISHSMASSSCVLKPGFVKPAALHAVPRLIVRNRPLSLRSVAGLAMPVPSPAQPSSNSSTSQSVGHIVPGPTTGSEDVLKVTTVHSPEELDATIAANKEQLIVLMIKAKGCRPCKLFGRKYARAADLYSNAVFLELFGDESKDTRALMVKMGIRVTPTFVLYRDGQRVHSHGGVNEKNFHSAIQSHLKETEAGFGKAPVPVSDADEE